MYGVGLDTRKGHRSRTAGVRLSVFGQRRDGRDTCVGVDVRVNFRGTTINEGGAAWRLYIYIMTQHANTARHGGDTIIHVVHNIQSTCVHVPATVRGDRQIYVHYIIIIVRHPWVYSVEQPLSNFCFHVLALTCIIIISRA